MPINHPNKPSPNPTLVFDWGDTLMKVFPQYQGPMKDWPEVAAMDGAAQELKALSGRYRLVVATNASESNAAQVRAALQRAGLGDFFHQVFTSREMGGSRKPDPAFFQGIAQRLKEAPDHLVMIGDDYRADILGAHQTGWKTIWLNPTGQTCPGLLPLHTAEVTSWNGLPAALQQLDLPDTSTCLCWLAEQGGAHTVWMHVQSVAIVAYLMAVWLRAAGQPVNPILAHRGGLLHDLAKMTTLRDRSLHLNHGELAAQLLAPRGQPELAEIARRHMLYSLLDETSHPRTWEEKLVYYADKLAEGGKLVSPEERLNALQRRYHIPTERIDRVRPTLSALQAEICAPLGLKPAELLERLKTALNAITAD